MDNYEWPNGYSHRFGLIYVDYTTQRRRLKESAIMHHGVITSNRGKLNAFLPGNDEQTPFLVKETIRFIHATLAVQFSIRELAENLLCHPDYPGRYRRLFYPALIDTAPGPISSRRTLDLPRLGLVTTIRMSSLPPSRGFAHPYWR